MNRIETVDQLEDELSCPTPGVLATLREIDGDVIILGAGGKMGPTLARMVRRGFDEIGQSGRKAIAVSRYSNAHAKLALSQVGVETISCDLLSRESVQMLPKVPNVIYMAGQKFGTSNQPELTWAMNTLIPAIAAEHFAKSRIVVFSTGCVYPFMPMDGRGAAEETPLLPPGDYANSCVGRERIFSYYSSVHHTPMAMFRLCYSIDLRYGVLHDIAQKVVQRIPVDVSMGWVQGIWQRDANARAIESLRHTTCPPTPLNVTGRERHSVRDIAMQFGKLLGVEPQFVGTEESKAWIWDASRSYTLFGPPTVEWNEMIEATAHWMQCGGPSLGKPTHFEVTDGTF